MYSKNQETSLYILKQIKEEGVGDRIKNQEINILLKTQPVLKE